MVQFLLGSLSSIFAALLLFLSRRFWISTWHLLFIKIYPNISGRYKVDEKADEKKFETIFPEASSIIELQQFGKNLKGTGKVISDNSVKLVFDISGFVTPDKIVVINYAAPTAETRGAGSYVLKVQGLDNRLIGHTAYICSRCDSVHHFPVEFIKLDK